ncbi:hypothetical protein J132_11142 [Termitomyces sp. J132]|nr:hypothetical protein H2248_009038 [Termitomyces sp. 'cryptogamus']KNZ76272.1 hypothetical protein J132_11142 [Termitomyces sp. J132]
MLIKRSDQPMITKKVVMPQDSVYKGTKDLLSEISRDAIVADHTLAVSLEDFFFPTSYDLGPARVVVPSSPPVWQPQQLPVLISADEPAIDPRRVLQSCPFDATFRAITITSPGLSLRDFDVITDRKNLRALLNFFKNTNRQSHRIDAELIGNTLLLYLGWSEWGYSQSATRNSYGMNFERKFTTSLSEGTIQHNRVIAYRFGDLKLMIKYQADACIGPLTTSEPQTMRLPAFTTPTGLNIISTGSMVSSESIVEIKTLREGFNILHPRTMEQLWFSQTPILMTGYHNGYGLFSSVEMTDTKEALRLWEQNNTTALQKVVRVLQMIREHLSRSLLKTQAIVLDNKGKSARIKFFSLLDERETTLPNDLRQMWGGH